VWVKDYSEDLKSNHSFVERMKEFLNAPIDGEITKNEETILSFFKIVVVGVFDFYSFSNLQF
jgi:hypothetical protein